MNNNEWGGRRTESKQTKVLMANRHRNHTIWSLSIEWRLDVGFVATVTKCKQARLQGSNLFLICRHRKAWIQCLPILEYNFTCFFKKWANPASFLFIFGLFKQTLQFLQQIYVKNVHPVYGARIRTYDLRNVSLFPITTRPGILVWPLIKISIKYNSSPLNSSQWVNSKR